MSTKPTVSSIKLRKIKLDFIKAKIKLSRSTSTRKENNTDKENKHIQLNKAASNSPSSKGFNYANIKTSDNLSAFRKYISDSNILNYQKIPNLNILTQILKRIYLLLRFRKISIQLSSILSIIL